MSLSSTSIKRPVTVSMFYVGIACFAFFAFNRIGVDLLPNISLPHLMVQTSCPNTSPEEIEKLITEPLESAASTIPSIKNIISVSKEGVSVLSIDFNWGTDMDFAMISLREKLDNVRFVLPKESGRPTIIRMDPSASPIMSICLSTRSEIQINDKDAILHKKNGNIAESKVNSFVNDIHKPMSKLNQRENTHLNYGEKEDGIEKLVELKEAARVLFKRRLEQLDGIAQVTITGGLEREIIIETDPNKLKEYQISIEEISKALRESNINLPAGSIMKGYYKYSLRTVGEFQNLKEIGETILKRNENGTMIRLADVAIIKNSIKEREGLTKINGEETVGLLINKEPEANTVDISKKVRKTVESLNKEYPEYKLQIVSDQSQFIENAISNVKQEIYWGGILAILVLFFFLSNIRSVFIIGITIPAALTITVGLMYLFNISFNIISLGGLALGIGMLLDNSIIVIENITRFKEIGYQNVESAYKGTNEVAMPIVTSTITTIAVFFPLIFIQGITAEIFKDQSKAIIFSLLSSIFVALTLVPMLASKEKYQIKKIKYYNENSLIILRLPSEANKIKKYLFWLFIPFIIALKTILYSIDYCFIRVSKIVKTLFAVFFAKVDYFLDRLIIQYENLLEWALEHNKSVISLTLALFTLTIFALLDMKKELIPESPQDEFVIELVYPLGTSINGNEAMTRNVEKVLSEIDGITKLVSNIGRVNEFDYLNREQVSINKTNILVKINSIDNYYKTIKEVQNRFNATKGIKYSIKPVESSYSSIIKTSKNDIVIRIKNKNIDMAFAKGNLIINKIKEANIKGLSELRMGVDKGEPEYEIVIDREKCLALGISMTDVSNQILNIVKGKEASNFTDFDKKIGIRIRVPEQSRNEINKILSSEIISNGKVFPLRNVVDYKAMDSYNEIWHEDQARTVHIYANLREGSIEEAVKQIGKVLNGIPKSNNEIITVGGATDEINSTFNSLYIALLVSALLMYMVLAAEFESLLYPFIIIISVPLGLIGGVLILYIFGESLSMISLIGLVILVGIADNDAVVKVEYILRKRRDGLSVKDAIVAAGRDRFRPIVMNSLTVIFGLIPMIIGIGAATQLRISLSLSIAGGLISSTILTLIVIPVLYMYFEKYSKK